MVSKRDLGVGYLLAVGTTMFALLCSGIAIPAGKGNPIVSSRSVLTLLTGSVVATGFTATGIALGRSELADERIWRISQWATLGLAVPTVASVLFIAFVPDALVGLGWRSVVMMNIASGGIIAILVGSLVELRAEHTLTKELNQRNTVFLRLFRHDIRTSVNLIQGHAERLADDDVDDDASLDIVSGHVDRIVRLSDAARRLDRLKHDDSRSVVDLSAAVEAHAAGFARQHPNADVETDVESGTFVPANDLLASVLDNLLRNAVEHADDGPRIRVTVASADRDGFVELTVRDDGPGFADDELVVHREEMETALKHSDGVGLWLSRWVVDSYDGEMTVGNADEGGAVVTVRLPAASSPASSRTSNVGDRIAG